MAPSAAESRAAARAMPASICDRASRSAAAMSTTSRIAASFALTMAMSSSRSDVEDGVAGDCSRDITVREEDGAVITVREEDGADAIGQVHFRKVVGAMFGRPPPFRIFLPYSLLQPLLSSLGSTNHLSLNRTTNLGKTPLSPSVDRNRPPPLSHTAKDHLTLLSSTRSLAFPCTLPSILLSGCCSRLLLIFTPH